MDSTDVARLKEGWSQIGEPVVIEIILGTGREKTVIILNAFIK
jgi:hypothetical protein